MDNREKILECALELFSIKGYDKVGVQEIAETSGITKPTLYYYFKSKLGLLESLLEQKGAVLINKIETASHKGEDISTVLFQVAKAYFSFCFNEQKFYFLMLGLMYSPRENETYYAVMPLVRKQYYMITKIFEDYSAKLGNMHGRQEQFAIGFLGMLNCFMMVWSERGNIDRMAEDKMVYSVVHQFLHGIFS